MFQKFFAWVYEYRHIANSLRYIGRLLKPAFKHLKNSIPVLLFLGFVLSLVAVWWLGPKWEFRGSFPLGSLMPRVLLTILIFLIVAVSYGFYSRRKVKNLEQEKLDAQEEDEARPFIEALEARLDDAMVVLKKNLDVKDYIYKLPWYMVIGAEDSGKTSLINRSGQKFELTTVTNASGKTDGIRRRRDAINLPHDINWWISQDAILIDPDGRLVTQKPGQEETNKRLTERLWLFFVEWLGKIRTRRPLNGLLLTIDLAKLASQQASDRKAYAALLRTRFREIMEQLGTRLPVYIVFTKFDLIKGFDVFFQGLSKSQRDEIFGITFTFDSKTHYDNWLDELDVWYDKFLSILNEQSFDEMAKATTLQERENLFSFVRQLIGIKQSLQEFLADVLESDPYSTPALVRGIYFTSVYQQGIPSNPFVDASAKNYEIPLIANVALPATSSAIFFARSLFFKVIYPEAGLAGDNQQVVDRRTKVMKIAAVVTGIGVITLIAGWHFHFLRNRHGVSEVLEASIAFNGVSVSERIDVTGKKLLKPLNHIRQAAMVFVDYEDKWPIVADMGLYQGRILGPRTVQAYQDQLATRYLPELGAGVVDYINASPKASNEKLTALRVYRMIEDMSNRRKKVVTDWMAKVWQESFPEKKPIQDNLMVHLDYAMDHVQADLPAYKRWVRDTQKELLTIPLTDRVYRTMKQNANSEFASPLDLRAEIGPAFDVIYKHEDERRRTRLLDELEAYDDESSNIGDDENNSVENSYIIPAMLTGPGFTDYFVEQNENITDLALVDAWVLGIRESVNYSKEDEKILREKIRSAYVSDYITTWDETLKRIEVQEFNNIPHAAKILKSLVGKYQPLQRMVSTVKEHTEIYAPIPEKDKDLIKSLLKDPNRKKAREIELAFSSLVNLIDSSNNEKPEYLKEVTKAINNVYEYILVIQDSANPGKKALQATQDRLAFKGADPITVLERVADGLPEPLNVQLADVAKQSWRVVLIRALQELERKWDAEVYQFYEQRLKLRYPFQHSRQDVSLKDFEAFFAPEGILSSFYDEHLKIFLEDNLEALYSEDREEYLIDAKLIDQLNKAWKIQEAFFNAQGALHVPFTLEPQTLSGTHRRSVLNADGQIIPYNHGSTYPRDMLWPNTLRKRAESKLVVINGQGVSEKVNFKGPWSWFRLMRSAKLKQAPNHGLILSYQLNGGVMSYKLRAEIANNPFTNQMLRDYQLPQFLLNNSSEMQKKAKAKTKRSPPRDMRTNRHEQKNKL